MKFPSKSAKQSRLWVVESLRINGYERVDVLAYKQGLFETREQAKRGVMAGLVRQSLMERFDKPGE